MRPKVPLWTATCGWLHAVDPAIDLLLRLVLGDAVALLDAANELVLLAVDDGDVVLGQLAPLLLDLAGELLPVAFNAIPIHLSLLWVVAFLALRRCPLNAAVQMRLPVAGRRARADFLCVAPGDCPHRGRPIEDQFRLGRPALDDYGRHRSVASGPSCILALP